MDVEKDEEMTPQASLEIIGRMMNESRKDIVKALGRGLMVQGMLVSVTALIIGIGWQITGSSYCNYLWLLTCALCFGISRSWRKKRGALIPRSFLSEIIGRVWITFGVFCCILGFGAGIWTELIGDTVSGGTFDPSFFLQSLTPVILLFFGLACCTTGLILKDYLVAVCGIVAGFGGFVGAYVFADTTSFVVAGVAFVSLVIPGLRIYFKNRSVCCHR